jgi:hypothetical protein
MESDVELNAANIFQDPKKWSPALLKRLNVEEHRATASGIFAPQFLPGDDDPCTSLGHI